MIRITKKILFSILDLLVTSALLRGKLYKLFGAHIGKDVKLEKIILVNFSGNNLGNLHIGDKVYVGGGCVLDLKAQILIGTSTKIAAGVNISTHVDCGMENPISKLYPLREENTIIGAHSWIGLGAIVMCGTQIGNHTIVGAGSLVNKNIPDKVIAFGMPARVVKEIQLPFTKTMSETVEKEIIDD